MKKVGLIVVLFLFAFSSLVYAVSLIDFPKGSRITGQNINIKVDWETGDFKYLTYMISSTGATSGIRYRTSAITVDINGKIATIDISHLVGSVTPGQTTYSLITITKEDIIKSLGEQHRAEVESMKPEKINIGANIQIYNAGTGEILRTIKKKEEVDSIARSFGFGSQDINDMESRFLGDEYTVVVPTEDDDEIIMDDGDPSGTGLRPSILVR